jgi:hypothetical protein
LPLIIFFTPNIFKKLPRAAFFMSISLPIQSLAIMRVATAIVLFACAWQLHWHADVFYAINDGLLPLHVATANNLFPRFLLALYKIANWYQLGFIILYASSICLALGYRYKWASGISFVVLLLLQLRNPYILQGGDNLLRLLLLWLILLPANTSLAIQKGNVLIIHRVVWVAFIIQIAWIYSSSAWLKGVEWHSDFTALTYVFAHHGVAKPFTYELVYHPQILRIATAVVYMAEWILPLLLLIGIRIKLLGYIGAIGLLLFHLFNAIFLNIGLFPWVGMVSLIPLLPFVHSKYLHMQVSNTLTNGVYIILLVLISVSAFYVLQPKGKDTETIRAIRYIGLYQRWDMFAPAVSKVFVRFVMLDDSDNKDQSVYIPIQPQEVLFQKDRFRKFSEYASNATYSYLGYSLCKYFVATYDCFENKALYMIEYQNKMGRVVHTTHDIVFMADCRN